MGVDPDPINLIQLVCPNPRNKEKRTNITGTIRFLVVAVITTDRNGVAVSYPNAGKTK